MNSNVSDMTGIVPEIYDDLWGFKPNDLATGVQWLKHKLSHSQSDFDMEIGMLAIVFDFEARKILLSKYHMSREETVPYVRFLLREYIAKLKKTFEESGAGVWEVHVGSA